MNQIGIGNGLGRELCTRYEYVNQQRYEAGIAIWCATSKWTSFESLIHADHNMVQILQPRMSFLAQDT